MRVKNLTNEERQHVGEFLLVHSKNRKMECGKREEASQRFDISIRTVSTIWSRAREQFAAGTKLDMRSRVMGHRSYNKINIDMEALKALPYKQDKDVISSEVEEFWALFMPTINVVESETSSS